jgi:NADH-quinone oxidoreductase subunit H
MPQIDVVVFFSEMFFFFVFFIFFSSALIHYFLIPQAEIFFVRRFIHFSKQANILKSLKLITRPLFNFTFFFNNSSTTWATLPLPPVSFSFIFFFINNFFFKINVNDSNISIFRTFFNETHWLVIQDILSLIFLLIGILLSVAFFTLVERKIMASTQRRKGPDLVGFWGILQPIADGLKLIFKENMIPNKANSALFIVAAILPFVIAFSSWIIVPLSTTPLSDSPANLIFLLALSSIGVYGIIFSGWASNSKYAFLGGLRSAAQIISYELIIGFSYLCVALITHSLNLVTIVLKQQIIWFIFPLAPVAIIFLIAMLAETNRTPFDLPEAEAELVAGYNVEYSSLLFAFFFLAEYANMLLMATLFSLLFLGGWLPLTIFNIIFLPGWVAFLIKILIIVIFFVIVRAALPRVRYDQLMSFSWKILLPLEFGLFFFYVSIVYLFEI